MMIPGLAGVYQARFKTELAVQFQYRAALVIWLLGLILEPLIYLVVWTTVARSQGGEAGGFSRGEFAAYFAILMVVNHATFTWHFWEFEWRVRHGFFSPVLLRPIHPIHADLAQNLTFKLLTFTVVAPVALLLLVSFDATFSPSLADIAAFAPALVLAMALRFCLEWTLALAAFWLTRVSAINQSYYVLVLFFSGQLAPLSLLPVALRAVATALPFRWMISFPLETLLGRSSGAELAIGYAAQLAWLGVSLVLLRVTWRAGVRRYSAVGA